MGIRKALEKQLRKEFPYLSPTITEVVVWYVCGETLRTFAQTYQELIASAEMEQYPKTQQDQMIYRTLLILGRETCQDTKMIDFFKQKIRETLLEMKRQAPDPQTEIKDSKILDTNEIFRLEKRS